MSSNPDDEPPLPRALELLWREQSPTRRPSGLSRERIVTAAIELADEDGIGALSMSRLAERLNCGTMSLYRHVANKDELLTFMLSAAPGPPPACTGSDWRAALENWAAGLWAMYHRHPWMLPAAAARPPMDPGQLAWLDAGLSTLAGTGLSERDKLAAALAVLQFVRGAAALALEASGLDTSQFPGLLRRLVDPARLPALGAAIRAGAFDRLRDEGDEFRSGLEQLLDGIAARLP